MEKTLERMLADRGYEYEGEKTTPWGRLRRYLDGDSHVYLFLYTTLDVLGVKEARALRALLQGANVEHAIVVCRGSRGCGLNNYVQKEVKGWSERIECFLVSELLVNPTQSCYYCPHRKLPNDEAAYMLQRYGPENLYRLRADDAIVRYFGWLPGDVIGVTPTYGGFEGLEHFRVIAGAE